MNIELIRIALQESLTVMEQEKANWDMTCDIYDDAIELCNKALVELGK